MGRGVRGNVAFVTESAGLRTIFRNFSKTTFQEIATIARGAELPTHHAHASALASTILLNITD